MKEIRKQRCAIYTRKSHEEGLEQEFNSLDAQREAGSAYILSQKHEGWSLIETKYDDGGYSGGSMERPALKRLMEDIAQQKIDVVIVYKVDRLSRSLNDFARMMDVFDKHQVSFVSVTQQFNTTTSMGRLTLNILLSFAQFEREVTGERIRDKIGASKQKGMWMGGCPPLGYKAEDRKLIIEKDEAKLIQKIFESYASSPSLLGICNQLNKEGHTTKRWLSQTNQWHGGGTFTPKYLHRTLTHPIYRGLIRHKKQTYSGQHEAIIDKSLWDKVQSIIVESQHTTRHQWKSFYLLQGKIKTNEGYTLSPAATHPPKRKTPEKTNKPTYRKQFAYYKSQKAILQGHASCPIKMVNATYIDSLVIAHAIQYLNEQHPQIHNKLISHQSKEDLYHWTREIIQVVTVATDKLSITLNKNKFESVLKSTEVYEQKYRIEIPQPDYQATIEEDTRNNLVTLELNIQIKRMDGRRLILSPDGQDLTTPKVPEPNPVLVQAIGRGYQWRKELDNNPKLTIVDLAKQSQFNERFIRKHLTLTRLSPMILHKVLTGQTSKLMGLEDLFDAAKGYLWKEQLKAKSQIHTYNR